MTSGLVIRIRILILHRSEGISLISLKNRAKQKRDPTQVPSFSLFRLDQNDRLNAALAAWYPPIPCTPPPGGVDAEHR